MVAVRTSYRGREARFTTTERDGVATWAAYARGSTKRVVMADLTLSTRDLANYRADRAEAVTREGQRPTKSVTLPTNRSINR